MKTTIIILILVVMSLILPNMLKAASPATDISQDVFISRQDAGEDMIILDVRTKEEFTKGHIKGAININHSDILSNLEAIPKDKDLVIYCRSGRRADVAARTLSKNGYDKLFHLDGDMNAWINNNKPVNID